MRLGQLARRLDKKPQELVDFLVKEHQITIETDLNTKVEGEALDVVMDAFKVEVPVEAPKVIERKPIIEEVISEPENEDNDMEETEMDLSESEIEDMAIEAVAAEVTEKDFPEVFVEIEDLETKTEEETPKIEKIARVGEDGEPLPELIIEGGVIKAPKPELDGPTVVGKIELPTIKRGIQFLVTNNDSTIDVTESIYEQRQTEKEANKKKVIEVRKKRKVNEPKKRPRKTLTEADRKAHEDRRAIRKKLEAEKERQEKKTQHYFENVQQKTSQQSKQKKKKEIEKAVKKQKAPKLPEPTTSWGKFKKWLNT